jgi:hypothetical protein
MTKIEKKNNRGTWIRKRFQVKEHGGIAVNLRGIEKTKFPLLLKEGWPGRLIIIYIQQCYPRPGWLIGEMYRI